VTPRFIVVRAALLATLAMLAACATPLGPGFRTERQSYALAHVSAAPAALEVRTVYRLRNTGNAPLTSIGARLPGPQVLGRRNLRILVGGREVAPLNDADNSENVEIPFHPPWPQRERRELVIEYQLAPGTPGHADISVAEGSTHVRHFGWFPVLLRPEVLFAQGGNAKEKIRATILVPAEFKVLAAGHERGIRRTPQGTEYRFELRGDDFEPFLVAGRYSEARFGTPSGGVAFWAFRPLDAQAAQRAAQRIAASNGALESAFGRLPQRPRTVYIVETPARLTSTGGADGAAGVGFPCGALLNSAALALDLSSEAFLGLVEHEMAHAWFGLALRPDRPDDLLLSEALAEYATVVAAEAREGDSARRHRAALLLQWYDESLRRAPEKTLESLLPSDPWEQRIFAYNKGALFFLALEDEFGKENVRRGLARMVSALNRRDDVNLHDLRASIEGESNRPAADFFRAWLRRTGIPSDFRARYEVKVAGGK